MSTHLERILPENISSEEFARLEREIARSMQEGNLKQQTVDQTVDPQHYLASLLEVGVASEDIDRALKRFLTTSKDHVQRKVDEVYANAAAGFEETWKILPEEFDCQVHHSAYSGPISVLTYRTFTWRTDTYEYQFPGKSLVVQVYKDNRREVQLTIGYQPPSEIPLFDRFMHPIRLICHDPLQYSNSRSGWAMGGGKYPLKSSLDKRAAQLEENGINAHKLEKLAYYTPEILEAARGIINERRANVINNYVGE